MKPPHHKSALRVLVAWALALLPGCPWFAEAQPPRVYEHVYLPIRQPNTNLQHPHMSVLRLMNDGRILPIGPDSTYAWGFRYRVKVTETFNRATQFWSVSQKETVEAVDVTRTWGPFRIHSISAPHFQADNRSFWDKTFGGAAEVLAGLDAAVAGGQPFDMLMTFGASPADPLVLTAIKPASLAPSAPQAQAAAIRP